MWGPYDIFLASSSLLWSDFILNWEKHVIDLLHKLNFNDLKPVTSHNVVVKHLYTLEDTPLGDPFVYWSIIGASRYLTHTWPVIAYIVNHLSQFLQRPTDIYWQAIKWVLFYLSGTRSFGLLFQHNPDFSISTYSNADWGSNIDDQKTVVAYCVFIGSNLVSSSPKKQAIVARSSMESEYHAFALIALETNWVQQLLLELHISSSMKPVLWCDNLSVGALAGNLVFMSEPNILGLMFISFRIKLLWCSRCTICSLLGLVNCLPNQASY